MNGEVKWVVLSELPSRNAWKRSGWVRYRIGVEIRKKKERWNMISVWKLACGREG